MITLINELFTNPKTASKSKTFSLKVFLFKEDDKHWENLEKGTSFKFSSNLFWSSDISWLLKSFTCSKNFSIFSPKLYMSIGWLISKSTILLLIFTDMWSYVLVINNFTTTFLASFFGFIHITYHKLLLVRLFLDVL